MSDASPTAETYAAHLSALDAALSDALARGDCDGLVLHSGSEACYPGDDQHLPFRATAHLRRWVPLHHPDILLHVRPGETPVLIRVAATDYWVDDSPPAPSYWQDALEIVEVDRFDRAGTALRTTDRTAFLGPDPAVGESLGLRGATAVERALDWHRATKTAHEVALTEVAARAAARAHLEARATFEAGAGERSIYRAYLEGGDMTGDDLPYHPVIALDRKAAILHYQRRRGSEAAPGWVCLVDAGAACDTYAVDLTRTWLRPGVEATFAALHAGLDRLERELVAMVAPGRPYPEIHERAQRGVGELLADVGVLTVGADEAFDAGLTRTFMPHGVGHHLGLQVHDVGGHQADPTGAPAPPPPTDPFLRNTRTCEPGHLLTIEPGVYFIPVLLDPLRASLEGKMVDWTLVDRLVPLGGIRIEDNVLCTSDGHRDLTRSLLPQ